MDAKIEMNTLEAMQNMIVGAKVTSDKFVEPDKQYCYFDGFLFQYFDGAENYPCQLTETFEPYRLIEENKMETELVNMAKAYAIGTYITNSEDEEDYDKFMSLNKLGGSEFEIWEPFETYPLREIQELVESEFNSALNFAKKAMAVSKIEQKTRIRDYK